MPLTRYVFQGRMEMRQCFKHSSPLSAPGNDLLHLKAWSSGWNFSTTSSSPWLSSSLVAEIQGRIQNVGGER